MKNSVRIFYFVLLYFFCNLTFLHAQDLTGIWRGHFRSNDGLERLANVSDERLKLYDDRYKMEVQIAQTENRFQAVTYSYKSTEFYGKAEASGSLNGQSKKVLLKEGKLLEVRFATGGVCIMTCFMQYSKLGNDEYLQGTYYSVSANDTLADCGKGSIFLHRVTESDFHKEPFLERKESELLSGKKENPHPKSAQTAVLPAKKPEVVISKPIAKPPVAGNAGKSAKASGTKAVTSTPLPHKTAPQTAPTARQKPSDILTEPMQNRRDTAVSISQPAISLPVPEVLKYRSNVLLKTLTIHSDQIELRLYDDGAIDNDTVSVYYDNKLLISKSRLTDQPITVRIPVTPSEKPHQLVMVAENLGEIPPNTSLLVVQDGEKRYEERIISTEQKNVQINFIYKKE